MLANEKNKRNRETDLLVLLVSLGRETSWKEQLINFCATIFDLIISPVKFIMGLPFCTWVSNTQENFSFIKIRVANTWDAKPINGTEPLAQATYHVSFSWCFHLSAFTYTQLHSMLPLLETEIEVIFEKILQNVCRLVWKLLLTWSWETRKSRKELNLRSKVDVQEQ